MFELLNGVPVNEFQASITDLMMISFAYLLGSASTAVLVSHSLNLPDPREFGSGNPGATNILRSGHRFAAAVTLIGDIGKGLISVQIAFQMGLSPISISLIGLAAIIGHLVPVFFQFRGGKGVATALGVCLGVSLQMGLLQISCWLVVVLCFRISSLAALLTALVTPLLSFWLAPDYLTMSCVISSLMIYSHRTNLINLIHGQETRI